MKKIVLTGAAGRLGSYLREPLTSMADELVSTDIVDDIGKTYEGETYQQGDLASLDDMLRVLKGAEMVVHMGAYADEGPFEQLLGPNFVGAYNIWESAYRNGLRRVVYGSSIHAVGMYPKNEFINTEVRHRPDTFYGLAKCFAEDLGSMYWDKRGAAFIPIHTTQVLGKTFCKTIKRIWSVAYFGVNKLVFWVHTNSMNRTAVHNSS